MIDFQIPDEALNYLRDLLEKDGETQWQIGEFIADYWQETLNHVKPEETREAHAQLIRKMAAGTGADRTTLRDREKMWLFYSDFDRSRFPMFTYHQWRALRKVGKENLEEWCVKAHDNSWSVAKIRQELKNDEDPRLVLIGELEAIEKKVRKIMDDERNPDKVREGLSLIPSIIQDTKEQL